MGLYPHLFQCYGFFIKWKILQIFDPSNNQREKIQVGHQIWTKSQIDINLELCILFVHLKLWKAIFNNEVGDNCAPPWTSTHFQRLARIGLIHNITKVSIYGILGFWWTSWAIQSDFHHLLWYSLDQLTKQN